jgi:hypothetical protein
MPLCRLDHIQVGRELRASMQDDAYTFLGNSLAGATLFMDIAVFEDETRARKHAMSLLGQHDSADVVEVWRAASLIGQIPRPGPAGPAALGG